jgi:hypothetical protein
MGSKGTLYSLALHNFKNNHFEFVMALPVEWFAIRKSPNPI